LATLAKWATSHTRLRVVTPSAADGLDAVDLSGFAAADPTQIGALLMSLRGAKGARGGAIASDEGVLAAIAAGFEFIVADPVLPPLLAAARMAAKSDPNVRNEDRS
jgi:pyruvate,orthophosphate dikinase